MPDSQPDVSELAREVVDELDPGSKIGDKFILSRRQLVGIAAGGLSVGALTTLGVDQAAAQEAAGAVGTESEPVDVFANQIEAQSLGSDGDGVEVWASGLNDGGIIVDGEGIERNIWVIEAGDDDPSDARADDLIFEEEG